MNWQVHRYHQRFLNAEKRYLPAGGQRIAKVAVVYPNDYGVGISNLGFQFSYYLFLLSGKVLVDRLFYPSVEERRLLDKGGIPLLSWEYSIPLRDFDIVAFSVSFEMDYFRLLRMLRWASIPLKRKDRRGDFPLVAVGGAVTFFNPFPLSDFVDFFVVGEGEDIIGEIVDVMWDKRGKGKGALLESLAEIEGVYVPAEPKETVMRARVKDMNRYIPFSPIVTPYGEWGKTALIEITRGCVFSCKFCAVSRCYSPFRFRDTEKIKRAIDLMVGTAEKIGFVSAVPMLHPDIEELSLYALNRGFKVAYSSVRIDLLKESMVEALVRSGYRSITIAPETGRNELRESLNKFFTNDVVFERVSMAYENGIKHLKLYFILGLPGEEIEDVYGIYELVMSIFDMLKGGVTLTVSVSSFVPKPFTPFEGERFLGVDELLERQHILKRLFSGQKRVKLVLNTPQSAAIQTLLSRGDERLGNVLLDIYGRGGYKAILKSCYRNGIDVVGILNGSVRGGWKRIQN